MNVLLIALGPSVPGDGLVAGVQALRRAGARVELVSRQPPSPALVAVLDGVSRLGETGGGGVVLRRAATVLNRLPKVRLDPDRLSAAVRIARTPATRALLDAADVLVAVDQAAIPAAWLAARSRPEVAALSGLPAAVTRYTR